MKSKRFISDIVLMASLILTAGLLFAGPAFCDCPPDITSYWKLDEASGTTFADFFGTHDAACSGSACPGFTGGRVLNALLFDGVDDALTVPPDASFNWGKDSSFTIEFWVKMDSTNTCDGNQVVVGRDDKSTNLHWWVGCWDNTGVAAFRLEDRNGVGDFVYGSSPLNDGQWHLVTAVRDGNTGQNHIFVDGRLEGSKIITYTAGFDSATAPLNIGWLNVSPFYQFEGAIDEVALYSQLLTETEILQHYLNGSVNLGYCANRPPAAPQIISPAVITAFQGWPYVYNADATGNPAPTFSLTEAPIGMTIDAGSGIIKWTPGSTADVTVSADNSEGFDEQNFTIEVLDPSLCPASITHYWELDETVADSYADLRWANSAICTDCPLAVAGVVNGAQQFDAISRVNVRDDNTFDWKVGDSFSIELWMKTDTASTCSGKQVLVGRNDGATSLHWWLGCLEDGHAEFYLRDTGGETDVDVTGTTDLTDGAWHHIVGTRDASSGTINIYVDGIRQNVVSAPYASGFASITAPLNIGWLNLAPFYHFVGAIDDVAVYNRVLSGTEIYQHYSAGLADLGYCDPLEPTIYSTPVTTANELVPYSYTVKAYGNPAPTFSLTTSPTGMTINPTTGVISWTPAQGQAGARNVTVRAANGAGADTQSFVINVTALPAYSLNITAVNGSVIKSPDQTMYAQGANVELTADPDAGYTFTEWSGHLSGSANPAVVIMNGNKVITANFTAIASWSVISPAAGAKIPSGEQSLIQWTAPPEATKFKLLYSLNNGATWTLIRKNIPTRTYPWTVSPFVKDKKKCLLKVVGFTDAGVNVGKFVSNLFTIEGTVKVITPNGSGDPLTSGSFYPIEWQTSASVSGSVAKVVLQYTLNGGTTWKKIASLPENPGDPVNPGSYNWTVPVVSSDKSKCLVKVTLKNAAGTAIGVDTSDFYFTINP